MKDGVPEISGHLDDLCHLVSDFAGFTNLKFEKRIETLSSNRSRNEQIRGVRPSGCLEKNPSPFSQHFTEHLMSDMLSVLERSSPTLVGKANQKRSAMPTNYKHGAWLP